MISFIHFPILIFHLFIDAKKCLSTLNGSTSFGRKTVGRQTLCRDSLTRDLSTNQLLCWSNVCRPNDRVITKLAQHCVSQMFVGQMTALRPNQPRILLVKCLLAKSQGQSQISQTLCWSNVCRPSDRVKSKSTKHYVGQISVGQMTASRPNQPSSVSAKCLLAK